jgi:hypothetical protein
MRLIGLAVVLAVSLFAATLATEAQSAEKVYQIGWLSPASATTGASNFDALRNGLGELGYVEGRNIRLRETLGRRRCGAPSPAGHRAGPPQGGRDLHGRHADRRASDQGPMAMRAPCPDIDPRGVGPGR